jgi:hypothetical protein
MVKAGIIGCSHDWMPPKSCQQNSVVLTTFWLLSPAARSPKCQQASPHWLMFAIYCSVLIYLIAAIHTHAKRCSFIASSP